MAHDLQSLERESLYDTDYFAWTMEQVAALRARGAGANVVDYDNLAEEVEDLGKSVERSCYSYLELIIEHLIKLEFAEEPLDRPHWRGEVANFRRRLNRELTRSLVNRLEPQLSSIFEQALTSLVEKRYKIDGDRFLAARPNGYTWAMIVDPEWLPRQ